MYVLQFHFSCSSKQLLGRDGSLLVVSAARLDTDDRTRRDVSDVVLVPREGANSVQCFFDLFTVELTRCSGLAECYRS